MASWGRLKRINEPFYPTTYYAVGDLYFTINPENPNTRFGYGTWVLFCPGRTVVCVDTSDSNFNTVQKTGGEKKHTLSVNEMPSHRFSFTTVSSQSTPLNTLALPSGYNVNNLGTGKAYTDYVGGGQSHNNLQPFITCYIWLRTA